jgi:hypothetical protein
MDGRQISFFYFRFSEQYLNGLGLSVPRPFRPSTLESFEKVMLGLGFREGLVRPSLMAVQSLLRLLHLSVHSRKPLNLNLNSIGPLKADLCENSCELRHNNMGSLGAVLNMSKSISI